MIVRDLSSASAHAFDVVVVGGGIYGASLLQEATRRGLSACLCEANDFGSATSWNSLRILHGGLRYLQTLDLRRFLQSVVARREMARRFPRLVRPLPCVMPLYGQGLKRPSLMRLALLVNDTLSIGRNAGLSERLHLGDSGILDAQATEREFPGVRTAGLRGAARWYDYFMLSSERVLIELLRDACGHGAVAINYARVEEVVVERGGVRGVLVRDGLSGTTHSLRTRSVVNCTGPWTRTFAQDLGRDADALFRPSLAFNVLLDATLPGESAFAVAAPEPGAPVLFVVPQQHGVLAGTVHLPRPSGTSEAIPTQEELEQFLAQLRAAIPGFNVRLGNVRKVLAGLLPAMTEGSVQLVKREVLLDHAKVGRLKGMYSVSGVKFTTAIDVASQTLRMMGHAEAPRAACDDDDPELPISSATELLIDAQRLWTEDAARVREGLMRTVREEAVHSLEDLILRRTNWAITEADLDRVTQRVAELVGTEINVPGSPAVSARTEVRC